jgi:DNA-binding winged helix-turn-helix (wHTH) protein/Flp pilus assembly protein TadD
VSRTTTPKAERARIGSYWFDPNARLLLRRGEETPLTRKAGDLLALLLANVGRLVPREAIFEHVWPEGFVCDGNLTQTVYLLRKSLAADSAIAIENVPRRGYRLRVAGTAPRRSRGRTNLRAIAVAGVIAAVIVAFGVSTAFHGRGFRPLPLDAREDAGLAMYQFERFQNLRLARLDFERMTKEAPSSPDGYAGLALVDAIDGFDTPGREHYCALGHSDVSRAKALGASTLRLVAAAMLSVTCDRSLPKARRELDAAIAVSPSDAAALALRARVAFWQSRPLEAIPFASKAVAADPTSPEALLSLALAYYYSNHFADARSTLQRLLELMPGRPSALDFLERSYEGLRDFPKAEETLRVAQRDPNNAAWVWAARARLLARSGRNSAALDALRRAAASSAPESLASAYAALGGDRAAIAELRIEASRHSLATQIAWLDDFRFAELRRKFPELTPTFVTWR